MSVDDTFVKDLQDSIVGVAQQTGWFTSVNKHEGIGNLGDYTAAVMYRRIDPMARTSGLDATSVRVEFSLMIYSNMRVTNLDVIDPKLSVATICVMRALTEGFTLGDSVMQVDLMGTYGKPLAAESVYMKANGTDEYRVSVILIPVIVDDVWDQEA